MDVFPASTRSWDALFAERSALFEPLRAMAGEVRHPTWPDRKRLSELASTRNPPLVNWAGRPIQFCEPSRGEHSAARYERRIAEEGSVEHREASWHDFFNALVWLTFPLAKAALNRRHMLELANEGHGGRGPVRDALTQFDEDGIVVLSEQPELLDLLRDHEWRELFWSRRADVQSSMRWFVFGHAQYEKALRPFVGVTAKAIMLHVAPGFCAQPYPHQVNEADRMAAEFIGRGDVLTDPQGLAPVPVLGIPGWFPHSADESFFADGSYFRTRRRCRAQ